jgi:hypothetical protein
MSDRNNRRMKLCSPAMAAMVTIRARERASESQREQRDVSVSRVAGKGSSSTWRGRRHTLAWWGTNSCMQDTYTICQTPGWRDSARLRSIIRHIRLRFGSWVL